MLADAGVEHVNAQVDDLITTGVLRRVLACRVEEERGGVQDRRRRVRAAPFDDALAEKPIAPFPLPGRVSHGGMRRAPTIGRVERRHAQFSEHTLRRELPVARPGDLMPAAEKGAD